MSQLYTRTPELQAALQKTVDDLQAAQRLAEQAEFNPFLSGLDRKYLVAKAGRIVRTVMPDGLPFIEHVNRGLHLLAGDEEALAMWIASYEERNREGLVAWPQE